jgi:hypothetical protein
MPEAAEREERMALTQWLRAHLVHSHFYKGPLLMSMGLDELQKIHRTLHNGVNQ